MANEKEQNRRKANPLSDKEILGIEMRSSQHYVEKENQPRTENSDEKQVRVVSQSTALRNYLDKKRRAK